MTTRKATALMSTPSLALPFRGKADTKPRARTLAAFARPELLVLLALAAVLDLWALDRNGMANDYYAAAVKSMTTSWNAFFFGTFDSSGVMTVDKPPLALWVQALSARVFGFGSWSLLVPQALMGVATVGLAYDGVRRVFGRPGAFAAGLVLALTPITVAISRHNNPDALLVLCSVGALWALVRALQDGGSTRWLIASGVFVGLGFEAKMAAALMVLPGIVAAWLWVAPAGRLSAVKSGLAAGGAMLVTALAWPVAVWLIPAANRPWISGTDDNSIWSLILGYNGLGRLFGQSGGPGGTAGGPGGGGGGMGGVFGGDVGPFRLLNAALGGQAGWLLGFALVAGIAVLVASRLKRTDARTGWLIAVGGAWLATAVAFSKAEGIFHPYYVSALAPMTAMLVGGGTAEMLRGGLLMRVLGPLAIAAGIVTELVVLAGDDTQLQWLPAVLVVAGVAASAALAADLGRTVRRAAVAAVLGVLLIAPGAWAFQTLGHATSSTFPAGGSASAGGGMGGMGGPGGMRGGFGGGTRGGAPPAMMGGTPPAMGTGPGAAGGTTGTARGGMGGGGMFGNDANLTAALAYAKADGGGTIAVSSQSSASATVIASGQVAAIGGFSGRESEVSIDWLADAVAAGKIRYVLTDGTSGGMGRDGRTGASLVMAAAAEVGKAVPSVDGLYDLRGLADALRATATTTTTAGAAS